MTLLERKNILQENIVSDIDNDDYEVIKLNQEEHIVDEEKFMRIFQEMQKEEEERMNRFCLGVFVTISVTGVILSHIL